LILSLNVKRVVHVGKVAQGISSVDNLFPTANASQDRSPEEVFAAVERD